jgi:SAM-dependent methyltransferase
MNLRALRRHWDAFGRQDPFWAVLTNPEKTDNRWDVEQFYRTGQDDVNRVMADLAASAVTAPRRRALDFGCGVGRVAAALAPHFDEVVGVDIAPSMIDLARTHVRAANCRFLLNERDDLRLFEDASFSFVHSHIVLQHIEPRHTRRYLAEFLRILEPGGVLLFQLPSEAVPETIRGLKRLVPRVVRDRWRRLRRLREFPRMEGYGIPRDEVVAFLAASGAKVLRVVPDDSAGPRWHGYRYCVRKA